MEIELSMRVADRPRLCGPLIVFFFFFFSRIGLYSLEKREDEKESPLLVALARICVSCMNILGVS